MMNILRPALVLAAFTLTLPAQVPQLIYYQGRVVVGTTTCAVPRGATTTNNQIQTP
jgi:hypothetical protein